MKYASRYSIVDIVSLKEMDKFKKYQSLLNEYEIIAVKFTKSKVYYILSSEALNKPFSIESNDVYKTF